MRLLVESDAVMVNLPLPPPPRLPSAPLDNWCGLDLVLVTQPAGVIPRHDQQLNASLSLTCWRGTNASARE